MLLLAIYVGVALGFSFLCSIAEAVLLSVTSPYVALMVEEGRRAGPVMQRLKADIGRPLAAILTLNTVAHTVGAAGAGAQAAHVFGDAFVGVISAVLTLLILVFSEIIPKSLGAHYWRQLAPATAWFLRGLIVVLYPFVVMSNALTRRLGTHGEGDSISRAEIATMADIGARHGELVDRESAILKNLLRLRETRARDVMTPRTVMFTVSEEISVADYFAAHAPRRFSRIPVYAGDDRDQVTGFVLRGDLLLAQARGNTEGPLSTYRRPLPAVPDRLPLLQVFDQLMRDRMHIAMLVDEYGTVEGLVTLEDVLETLIGMEIVDEGDKTADMQRHARRLWKRRATEMGLDTEQLGE